MSNSDKPQVPKITPECGVCRFFMSDSSTGLKFCRRYPKYEIKGSAEWCGEFKVKD